MTASIAAPSQDLLPQVEATARRLADKTIRPRIRAFDSPDSRVAWSEIVPELNAQGLLDPTPNAGDPAAVQMVAAILREVAQSCPGVAAGLWAHYTALLPFSLADKLPVDTPLLAEALFFGADQRPGRAFGSTFANQAITYVETSESGVFQITGLNVNDSAAGLLGLRACRFASFLPKNGEQPSSASLALPLASARRVLSQCEAVSLVWLSAVAESNANCAIREAREYAAARYQGGGTLTENPVILQMLGRMEMLDRAAAALIRQSMISLPEISLTGLTKAYATQTGEQICTDAVQVLGGYGYMEDYGLEKRMRDAKTLCVLGAPNSRLLERAGDHGGAGHGR